jgi:hypothetical protein
MSVVLIAGCASTRTYRDGGWQIVSEEHKVEIQVRESEVVVNGITLQQYDVRYVNYSPLSWCVQPQWRLVDLENRTYDDFVALGPYETTYVGTFAQKPWEFKEFVLLVPPSGYVSSVKFLEIGEKADFPDICIKK